MLVKLTMEIFDYLEDRFLAIDDLKELLPGDRLSSSTVEDVVIRLVTRLNVNALGAHLFALYERTTDVWLCPSQTWCDLSDLFDKQPLRLYLRIRFLGYHSTVIYKYDRLTFEYFFAQIRHDFLNTPRKKFDLKLQQAMFGQAIYDALRVFFEEKRTFDEKSIAETVKRIGDYLPNKMVWPKFSAKEMNKKIESTIKNTYECVINSPISDKVFFVKRWYIDQYLDSQVLNNLDEQYLVDVWSLRDQVYKNGLNRKFITLKSKKLIVSYRVSSDDNWKEYFHVKDILYIIPYAERKNTVQIFRSHSPPVNLVLENERKLRSFVSLLAGYYRMTERWNFNICSELPSPWLVRLRRIRSHGPISAYLRKEKFVKNQANSNSPPGCLFLFQQMPEDFKSFRIYFERNGSFCWLNVRADLLDKNAKFHLWEERSNSITNGSLMQYEFESAQKMFDYLKIERNLTTPIVSSENDVIVSLLKLPSILATQAKISLPIVLPSDLTRSSFCIVKTGMFNLRFGRLTRDKKVMIKEFVKKDKLEYFLQELGTWASLNDKSLINCTGIIINPLTALFECHQTTLKELCQSVSLSLLHMIEAMYSVARAMDYLYGKGVVHGYIRFENLYVWHYERSLTVKLGDPIGWIEMVAENDAGERAWLPPEYFDLRSSFSKKLTFCSDVWAFGTTAWEIFTNGKKPEFDYLSIERKMLDLSRDIPPLVFDLLTKCWQQDCTAREQPMSVFRTVCQILTESYDLQRKDDYQSIDETTDMTYNSSSGDSSFFANLKKGRLQNRLKSWVSTLSLSSGSIYSGRTVSTQVNHHDSDEYGDGEDDENDDDDEPDAISIYTQRGGLIKIYEVEPIKEEQLTSMVKIGSGNYGKVVSATLKRKDRQMIVAVKLIGDPNPANSEQELEVMKNLKHKNIVRLIGWTDITIGKLPLELQNDLMEFNCPKLKALVMEFIERGALHTYLPMKKCQGDQLNVPLIKFALDVAEGMAFLASKNIIHRDLAARNILVKAADHVQISDFGLAHILNGTDEIYKTKSSRPLPLRLYAPESLTQTMPQSQTIPQMKIQIFKPKSDVWSYGLLLWEMYSFCKCEPFEEIQPTQLYDYLAEGNRLAKPDDCPDHMYRLMQKCWQFEINDRPDFETILKELRDYEFM